MGAPRLPLRGRSVCNCVTANYIALTSIPACSNMLQWFVSHNSSECILDKQSQVESWRSTHAPCCCKHMHLTLLHAATDRVDAHLQASHRVTTHVDWCIGTWQATPHPTEKRLISTRFPIQSLIKHPLSPPYQHLASILLPRHLRVSIKPDY